jgi:hypothetical protein
VTDLTATRLSVVLVGLALAPSGGRADPVLPDFSAADFEPGAAVDNPLFPLLDPRTRVFVSRENGEDNRFELTVLGPGPVILGVQTTTQRDRSYENGRLVEDTFDYYAQDGGGNVWYFGEDVTNYLYDGMGNLIGTTDESSWRAGENLANPGGDPAQPGFIMPVDQTLDFEYYQEFAVDDEALDEGKTSAVLLQISVPVGDFDEVLRVLETTAVEPNARGFKYYAPDVGLVLEEEGLNAQLQNPDETFELTRVVPEPAGAEGVVLGVLALLGYVASARRGTE